MGFVLKILMLLRLKKLENSLVSLFAFSIELLSSVINPVLINEEPLIISSVLINSVNIVDAT